MPFRSVRRFDVFLGLSIASATTAAAQTATLVGTVARDSSDHRLNGVEIRPIVETNLSNLELSLGGTAVQQRNSKPIATVGVEAVFHRPLRDLTIRWSRRTPPGSRIRAALEDVRLVVKDEPPKERVIQFFADRKLRIRVKHLSQSFQVAIVTNQIDGADANETWH